MIKGLGIWSADWQGTGWLKSLQEYKALGFNTVTLTAWWTRIEREDGTYDEEAFYYLLDLPLAMCQEAGVNAVIEVRATWGAGVTDWAGWLRYWDGASNGIANIYDQSGSLFPRLLKFIGYIAERYAGQPNVIGFNPENYPFHNKDQTIIEESQYHTAIPLMIQAIRQYTQKTIFLSPIHKGLDRPYSEFPANTNTFNRMPAPTDTNLAYLMDGYAEPSVGADAFRPLTKEEIRTVFQGALAFKAKYNAKIMIDEFGVPTSLDVESDVWQTHIKNLLDVYNEFTDMWMWQGGYATGGGWNLYDINGNVISPKTLELIKTYATMSTPTPRPSGSAAVGGYTFGGYEATLPPALCRQLWKLRQKYIRPEVHRKIHPLV